MSLTQVSNQVIQSPYKRNVIINGACNVWQRVAGVPLAGGQGGFSADRFKFVNATDGTVAATVGTNGNAHNSMRNYAYAGVTTADASLSAAQAAGYQYIVEGYDIRSIVGQVCTLSFWIYSSIGGIICVSLSNAATNNTDRCYVTEVSTVAGTWVYRTITFTMHDLSSGSYWNTTNDAGLRIWWALGAGSNFITATKNSWITGNYVATSNQVNHMSVINSAFAISGVQLEVGATATPFEYKSFSEELAACQRYYEKSYNIDIQPGTISALGQQAWLSNYTAQGCYCDGVTFTVCKRATPIMVFYSTGTGTANRLRNSSAAADITVTGSTAAGMHGYQGPIPTSESMSNGHLYNWQWTAEAEL